MLWVANDLEMTFSQEFEQGGRGPKRTRGPRDDRTKRLKKGKKKSSTSLNLQRDIAIDTETLVFVRSLPQKGGH